MKIKHYLPAAFASLLAACTTLPPGAIPYSSTEIEAVLTGRTWLWNSGGGLYFGPNGKAIIKLEDGVYDTDWVAEDGKFCHSTTHKGGPYCWGIFKKDGKTFQYSLFQPEYSEPYPWNPQMDTVRGNRIKK